jgi:hypothetical protein
MSRFVYGYQESRGAGGRISGEQDTRLIGGLEEIGGASPALHTCGEQNLCKSAKSAVTFALFMPFPGYSLWVLCGLCGGESFTEFFEFAAITLPRVFSGAAFDNSDS